MSGPMGDSPVPFDSPIEDYLDELLRAGLRGSLRETRHMLTEAEAHLRDVAAEAVVSSGHASGQWLSAAPVALGLAVVFGLRLAHELRQPPGGQLSREHNIIA